MEKHIIGGLSGTSGIINGNSTPIHLRDIEDLMCAASPNPCGESDGRNALLIGALFSVSISRLEGV